MQENHRIFQKRIAQFFGFGVFLYVISPYMRQLKGARFESRRVKKRRRLAEEEAAARCDREEGSRDFARDPEGAISHSHGGRGILPVVKAADVTDYGTGYAVPRSRQFNFIADAVEKASPSVVFIEIHGRYACTLI